MPMSLTCHVVSCPTSHAACICVVRTTQACLCIKADDAQLHAVSAGAEGRASSTAPGCARQARLLSRAIGMASTVSPAVQLPSGGGKPCSFAAHPRAACLQPAKQRTSTAATGAGTTVTSAAAARAACVPSCASMGTQGSSSTLPAWRAATAAAGQAAKQLSRQCKQRICTSTSDQ